MAQPKIKDTDYLFLSARIKALECNLLTKERMDRMLDAPTVEDAAKVLQECGYAELPRVGVDALEETLADQRQATIEDLTAFAPDVNIIDVFKVKYDYHNAKVLLKAEAMNMDPKSLLVSAGRVPVNELEEMVSTSSFSGLPGIYASAIQSAREVLATTGDPQLADFVLDRAYFEDMFDLAEQSGSKFLRGYVAISIDSANIRSAVRTMRMEKSADFLKGVLFEGGNVDVMRILNAVSAGGSLEELYAATELKEAAEAGAQALRGGGLTRFEKLCDDAVNEYLSGAKYVPFGDAPLIGYLAAKESEYTAVRIIMNGRMANLDRATIEERLREAYV